MSFDAGDDAVVAGDFGFPCASLGVVAEGDYVGQLGFEGRLEFGGGDVVVALFADVGVGAGFGDEVSGAVAVGDSGFEHFGAEWTRRGLVRLVGLW